MNDATQHNMNVYDVDESEAEKIEQLARMAHTVGLFYREDRFKVLEQTKMPPFQYGEWENTPEIQKQWLRGNVFQTLHPEQYLGGDRIEQIARAAYEINRTYCLHIGDFSYVPWDDAQEWQRESTRNGVAAILRGEADTAEEQHEIWMNEKLSQGWKYGPVKDAEKKEHPCCVPYEQLPWSQRAKDWIFRAVVDGMRDR